MTQPTFTDFDLAIQNPAAVFQDPDLRGSVPELTPLGLPKARAGNIAVTYKLERGGTSWAVRCFHREIPSDLQRRYGVLTNYFAGTQVEGFLPFRFLQSEMWAAGQRNPVVKMAWASGDTLGTYVDHHFDQAHALQHLSAQFLALLGELGDKGIAHGDLQNGNLVVTPSHLTLVDYDGLYVPTMSFTGSNERGHVNFQSPLREESHFGAFLDHFASIVIWLSLQAVMRHPNLWKRFHTAENLIFQGSDFVDPSNSEVLNEVAAIGELASRVDEFKKLCQVPLENLPTLSQFVNPSVQRVLPLPVPLTAAQASRTRQHPAVWAGDLEGLRQRIGERVEVIGQVYDTTTRMNFGRPYAFVNFDDWTNAAFRVVIWSTTLSDLANRGIKVDALPSRWMSITGLVQTWGQSSRQWLQIVPSEAADLRILSTQAEAEDILNAAAKKSSNVDTLGEIQAMRAGPFTQSGSGQIPQNLIAQPATLGNQAIRDRIQKMSSPPGQNSPSTIKSGAGGSSARLSGLPPVHVAYSPPPPPPPPPPVMSTRRNAASRISGSLVCLLILGLLLVGGIWYFTSGQASQEVTHVPTTRATKTTVTSTAIGNDRSLFPPATEAGGR